MAQSPESREVDQHIDDVIVDAREGRIESARKTLERIVAEEPDSARAWFLLSQMIGERTEAIYCLEQVLRIDPGSQQAQEMIDEINSPSWLPNVSGRGLQSREYRLSRRQNPALSLASLP